MVKRIILILYNFHEIFFKKDMSTICIKLWSLTLQGYPVPNLNQTFPKIKKYHTENPPHTYFRSIKKWGWVSSVLPGILREITNKLSQYLVKESLTLKIALTLPRQHKDCIRFIAR